MMLGLLGVGFWVAVQVGFGGGFGLVLVGLFRSVLRLCGPWWDCGFGFWVISLFLRYFRDG